MFVSAQLYCDSSVLAPTATATINGDLVFQFVSWVRRMRSSGMKVMVLGAPFEADAQLVRLQMQKLIDCILTQDGDTMLLGASLVQFGYNTRGVGKKKYFNGKFPSVDGQELNSWLSTAESKAAAAAFLGTDYNTALYGVTLHGGTLRRLVEGWCQLATHEERCSYLTTQETHGRYKTKGSQVLVV